MELKEIENKEEWEGFLLHCSEKTFLQSWNWGEFNLAMGYNIWRIGIYNGLKLLAVALVIKISAKRGTFLFVPHGPVIIEGLEIRDKKEILELLLAQLNQITTEQKASFLRICPIWQESEENINIFKDTGFRRAPIHMHPEITWELDITLILENILMGMRKTTRYLIRQAEKNPDIEIIKSNNIDDLKLFWPVYLKTAKRHNFVVFSKKYLEAEFNAFRNSREIAIFLGKYKSEVVSVAIFIFWQDMCFYHHSGSLVKYNKIPVSYLLQWEAIKEAKARGCRTYNFWGISPNIKTSHPWSGLSLFKMGFGGYKKKYVKTRDYVISPKYWLNYIIETIRKKKRGL
jgi:peptidoglycan pentaglycine glycine transferase (the first glycine)